MCLFYSGNTLFTVSGIVIDVHSVHILVVNRQCGRVYPFRTETSNMRQDIVRADYRMPVCCNTRYDKYFVLDQG